MELNEQLRTLLLQGTEQYLVPPPLKRKLIYAGFQFSELAVIGAFLLIGIVSQFYPILLISAILIVLLVRWDKEHNLIWQIKTWYNYYSKSNHFSSKEVLPHYEQKNNFYHTTDSF